MSLPTRPLDDRSFQDLVDEATKKIPLYCPEWTDHNLSDPGITLIELFAWMVDIILYRLNQLPYRHYVKMLELLGIRLEPPSAAKAPLTFYLSAPQPDPVVIPRGTTVSTARAEEGEAIVFTTDDELSVGPARLSHLLVRRRSADGNLQSEEIGLSRLQREFRPFSAAPPQVDEALLFGFDEPLDYHYVGLDLVCPRAGGLNIIPESPPLAWQAWTDGGWRDLDVEEDGTGGMTWSGQVRLHLPKLGQREVGGIEAYWVRCAVVAPTGEQRPYATSPVIREVSAVTWGATVTATHSTEVREEPLGRSDGSPGQVYHLEHTPVLPRREDERVEIWQSGMQGWEPWAEVDGFSDSGPEDRHCTCDSVTGEICFPPALRQGDGSVRRYGVVPPRGADIRFSYYRYGGGTAGNVRAGAITEAKTPHAYVDHVSNRQPAQGGLDAETLDNAIFRAQGLLRTHYRAVTSADYEILTLQRFAGEIARVRCLQTSLAGPRGSTPSPGQVYVVVVPHLSDEEATRYIPLVRLALTDELHQQIMTFLDERRLLTTRLDVRAAEYKRVRVQATIVAGPGTDTRRLEREVISALERFVNPLRGGQDGRGWPFGRELYLSDLYNCVQAVSGLQYVQEIQMSWVDENDVPHPAERRIELLAHEVLTSDLHQVKVVIE